MRLTEKKTKNRSDYHIRSVQRALQVLNAFSMTNPYLGVTEIAEITAIHKSTVHAILITLEDEGYVAKDIEKQKYFLTYKLFQLGSIVVQNVNALSISRPYMELLCKDTGQSVSLNVLSQKKRLVVDVFENEQPLKLTLYPGELLSLHSSAAGKVLMAGLSKDEFEDIVSTEGLKPMTHKTITDKKILEAELELVRKNGYALCIGESYWAGSVGVPLKNYAGQVVASLCIYGPIQDYESNKLDNYISSCLHYSDMISKLLGFNL